MAGARSRRLAGPTLLTTTTDVAVYTCPSGKVALLKDLRLVTGQQVGAGQGAHILVGIGGTGSAQLVIRWILGFLAYAADASTDPIVLAAGETLYARHSGASGMSEATITVSGAELDA